MVRYQSASVPMYAGETHGKTRYTMAFFHDGRRKRRMFTYLEKAQGEAEGPGSTDVVAIDFEPGGSG